MKAVDPQIDIVPEHVTNHGNAPVIPSELGADAASPQFTVNLPKREVLYAQFVDQLNHLRFFRDWDWYIFALVGCAIPVYLASTCFPAQLGLANLSAVHIPQQLPAKVLGPYTFEVEH